MRPARATSPILPRHFFWKVDVADGEHFVYEENFRLEMGGDGEGEADVHTGGIVLDGGVDEFVDFGEGYDFVELAVDLSLAHAQDGAAEIRILATGELAVEAGTDLEEAADASANLRPSGRRPRNARKDLQERGLTSTVATDKTKDFAFADFERNVPQGPEGFVLRAAECGERRADEVCEHVAQRIAAAST